MRLCSSFLICFKQFKKDIDEHQPLTESVLQKGEILLQCLLDNTPVLKDILGRISRQPSELESHADHLYDTILASLDRLAGCTLVPDGTPMAHRSASVKGISLVGRATQEKKNCPRTPVLDKVQSSCSSRWWIPRSLLS